MDGGREGCQKGSAASIEEPEVSPNLKIFLHYVYGTQWEVELIRESGEVLIEQLKAYLAGYNQLTSLNRRQWLRLFPAWTAQERRDQLRALADAGGFWVIWGLGPFLRVVGRSRPAALLYVVCHRPCGKKFWSCIKKIQK